MSDIKVLSNFVMDVVKVVEVVVCVVYDWIGCGEKELVDQVVVDVLWIGFNVMVMKGCIVIGEGECDEVFMFYIGEEVGMGEGLEIDIVFDLFEGILLIVKNMFNVFVVFLFSLCGGLLYVFDIYMDKIVVGLGFFVGVIDLDVKLEDNVIVLVKVKEVDFSEIMVCIFECLCYQYIVDGVKFVGGCVCMILDGDVVGVMGVVGLGINVDMYIGQGGVLEGVFVVFVLCLIGGQMQVCLVFCNDDEWVWVEWVGVKEFDCKYDLFELVVSYCFFVVIGVIDGDLVIGV